MISYVERIEDAANFHAQRADAAEDEMAGIRRAVRGALDNPRWRDDVDADWLEDAIRRAIG